MLPDLATSQLKLRLNEKTTKNKRKRKKENKIITSKGLIREKIEGATFTYSSQTARHEREDARPGNIEIT